MSAEDKKKLRVAVLSRNYPRAGALWLGTYVAAQVKALRRRADVRVLNPVSLTPPVSEFVGWFQRPERLKQWLGGLHTGNRQRGVLHYRWLPLPKRPFEATEGVVLAGVLAKALLDLRRRGWWPDLLHAHFLYPDGMAAVFTGRLLGLPAVVTAHGSDLKLLPRRGPSLRAQVGWTARHARALICVSRELRDLALRYGAEAARTFVIPNGYDAAAFRPLSRSVARQQLGLPKSARLLVYAGNLYPVKGPDILLEAFSRLNGWRSRTRLMMVGDGFLRTRLESQARQLGIYDQVQFSGARPHAEIPLWLAAADVVVLPSRSEGWPTVVVEALAAGRPVVATRVGAVPEMIRDGKNGFSVGPEQPEELARALVRALTRRWNEREIRETARLLTWDEVAARIYAVYQEVTST